MFTDINQLHTFMGDDWSLLGTSSRSLALLACQLYAVYGFETYLTAPKDARRLHADAGAVVRDQGAAARPAA